MTAPSISACIIGPETKWPETWVMTFETDGYVIRMGSPWGYKDKEALEKDLFDAVEEFLVRFEVASRKGSLSGRPDVDTRRLAEDRQAEKEL